MFGSVYALRDPDKDTGPRTTKDIAIRLIDAIQHRYGWTDETVMSLTVMRLNEIAEVITISGKADYQSKQIHSSFLGWQLTGNITSAMGRTEPFMNFLDYLKGLSIIKTVSDDPEIAALDEAQRKRERKLEAAQAIATAERIVALDQKSKK